MRLKLKKKLFILYGIVLFFFPLFKFFFPLQIERSTFLMAIENFHHFSPLILQIM